LASNHLMTASGRGYLREGAPITGCARNIGPPFGEILTPIGFQKPRRAA
jgi:hypothetical protein